MYNKTDAFLCQEYIFFRIISLHPIATQNNRLWSLYIITASFMLMKEAVFTYSYILVAEYKAQLFDIIKQFKECTFHEIAFFLL